MTSYDIIADKVRVFWKRSYPRNVIAFFNQKYEHETEWEHHAELVFPESSNDFDTVIFEDDFCEGQTEVCDIMIIPLDRIIEFYYNNILW